MNASGITSQLGAPFGTGGILVPPKVMPGSYKKQLAFPFPASVEPSVLSGLCFLLHPVAPCFLCLGVSRLHLWALVVVRLHRGVLDVASSISFLEGLFCERPRHDLRD